MVLILMVQLTLYVFSIFDEFEFDASDGGALNAWSSPFVSSIGLVSDCFLVHPE
ncbi:hypothetical protein [Synechococcus sp. MU1625]|uniref:hypothetical protein n=1 Tax=Synechococcus sp. MU1625 TaxID=2508347 RepID=UPI001CF80027|nr:hypothetical protein [Synechococcus sp. MU1625]